MKTLHTLTLAITCASLLCCKPNKKTHNPDEERAKVAIDSVEKVVKRGNYLVNHVAACLYCHSKRDFSMFSGPIVGGTEGMGGQKFDKDFRSVPGEVYSRNITPAGIGSWSNDAVILALTRGISQRGDTLYPIMPYAHFAKMSKDDVLAVVAYLRTLNSIPNEIPKRKLKNAFRAEIPTSDLSKNVRPAFTDRTLYGEYLVNMAACVDCHTPTEKNNLQMDKAFGGGQEFRASGFVVRSANITPDSITGIGTWTEKVFLAKFSQYRTLDGYNYNPGKANSVMPWTLFAGMDDFDLKAIYAYLRTLKPVKNKVIKNP